MKIQSLDEARWKSYAVIQSLYKARQEESPSVRGLRKDETRAEFPDMSARSLNVLLRNGIYSRKQASVFDDDELLSLGHCGPATLREIREACKGRGAQGKLETLLRKILRSPHSEKRAPVKIQKPLAPLVTKCQEQPVVARVVSPAPKELAKPELSREEKHKLYLKTCAAARKASEASDVLRARKRAQKDAEKGKLENKIKDACCGFHDLNTDESHALFEEAAQYYLQMSGPDFLRRYDVGEFDTEIETRPELRRLEMLILFGR